MPDHMPDKKTNDRRMTKPQAPRNSTGAVSAAKAPIPAAPRQLDTYEAAMKLFHARQLKEARELFLLAADGGERDIAQRCRLHIAMCDRRLPQEAVHPGTAEEMYNYGVALLNTRNFAEARVHLEKAIQLAPGADHIHYALALAQGLTGDVASAYDNLSRAIELDPRNRQLARQDADFAPMAAQPAFHALLYPDKKNW
jgi:tetratricopeptide (TPR) repeat protein